jgi:hypothetical protein
MAMVDRTGLLSQMAQDGFFVSPPLKSLGTVFARFRYAQGRRKRCSNANLATFRLNQVEDTMPI